MIQRVDLSQHLVTILSRTATQILCVQDNRVKQLAVPRFALCPRSTDKDGGAILTSYEPRQRQALRKEAMQLSLHLGTGKSAEVQDNILSFSLWPKVVFGRSGRAKEAVSTLPPLADLAKLGRSHPHPS